jgi:hypothetical protein
MTYANETATLLQVRLVKSESEVVRLRSLASSLAGALRDCLREVDACIRVLAREGIIQSENVGKDKRDEFRKALAEYEAANPARPPASEPGP